MKIFHITSIVLSIFIDETFEAIDLLSKTFEKYNSIIMKRGQARSEDFLTGLTIPNGSNTSDTGGSVVATRNAMDELHEIFFQQANISNMPYTMDTLPLEPQQVNQVMPIPSTSDLNIKGKPSTCTNTSLIII